MVYADTDFFIALVKDDDWLQGRAVKLLEEHGDELRTSVATFIELFWLCEEYDLDREGAITHILELADVDVEEACIYRASEHVSDGLNVLDAFHAALADDRILSSGKVYDRIDVERIALEPEEP